MKEFYQFEIGRLRCSALNDGDFAADAAMMFAAAPKDELAKALQKYGEQADHLSSPLTCLLVETGQEKVLIDCGMGQGAPFGGRLMDNLSAAGHAADEIDIVVLTHVHNDHALGAIDEAGRPAFPNAQYIIGQAEYKFWTDEQKLQTAPEWVAETARRVLPPLKDHLRLMDRRGVVVPGIEMLPAYGHTEGHMVVEVSSDGQRLLFLSDLALHPIHLEYPEWSGALDQYPERVPQTRREIFDYAVQSGALVTLFHFKPFPSLGKIVENGESWGWQAAE